LSDGLDLSLVDQCVPSGNADTEADETIRRIVADVRERGDAALFDYSRRFDSFELGRENIRVPVAELAAYAAGADDELVGILQVAASNIRLFHEEQRQESWEIYGGDGIHLGQRVTPISRVGIYIPGFKAAYPSSVLMNAIPAQVAGVERIAAVTPPGSLAENPLVAAALNILGIEEVYRVGGAHAIAALAFGTDSIPAVDKIVGPGNRFVQGAKREVFGRVHIDMIAGPSEVAIVADQTCDPQWIAADLLAQAEHDEMACVWLVCWSEDVAAAVFDEIQIQLETLDRDAIARVSVANNGVSFVVGGEADAVALVNHLAPEHVEVLMAEPDQVADGIRNAGAVFVGRYSPTVVGDYFAGPNHVLPTGRSARFFSPLGVYDFTKRTSIVRYSGRAIERSGSMIEKFAIAEGLTGHARSITVRNH
jgi:histidinol dehydrogenase